VLSSIEALTILAEVGEGRANERVDGVQESMDSC
jgi:hypothetical protein